MSLFETNYSNNKQTNYTPLPEGEYECTITKAGLDATPGGTEYLAVNLKVRNDLDKALPDTNGKYHNRTVFVQFWKNKQTGKYNLDQLQYVLEAAGVPEGRSVKDWEDFSNLLVNKPVRAFVKVEKDTYQGKSTERNRVAPWGFSKTKFPFQSTSTATDPFASSKEDVEITDEDVPF